MVGRFICSRVRVLLGDPSNLFIIFLICQLSNLQKQYRTSKKEGYLIVLKVAKPSSKVRGGWTGLAGGGGAAAAGAVRRAVRLRAEGGAVLPLLGVRAALRAVQQVPQLRAEQPAAAAAPAPRVRAPPRPSAAAAPAPRAGAVAGAGAARLARRQVGVARAQAAAAAAPAAGVPLRPRLPGARPRVTPRDRPP